MYIYAFHTFWIYVSRTVGLRGWDSGSVYVKRTGKNHINRRQENGGKESALKIFVG